MLDKNLKRMCVLFVLLLSFDDDNKKKKEFIIQNICLAVSNGLFLWREDTSVILSDQKSNFDVSISDKFHLESHFFQF